MSDNIVCQHCGKVFSRKWNCLRHETTCVKNPNVISKPTKPTIMREIDLKCKYCGKLCKNKMSIRAHERTCPSNPHRQYVSHTIGHTAWNKGLTKETSVIMQNIAKNISVSMKGRQGHKHTEETKRRISESRKQQIANNGGIWWSSRSKCKRSYAEEWTKHVLENETDGIKFCEEYHIGKWFLDFAWPDRQIGLEIDGKQHEWPERQQMDKEKDDYCVSHGWKILRLKWSDIVMNKLLAIKIIKEFVLNSTIIDYNFKHKTKDIKKDRVYLSELVWNERKDAMLNSGVDMSKYGWQTKMMKCTGLSKRRLSDTVERYPDVFKNIIYIRKSKFTPSVV